MTEQLRAVSLLAVFALLVPLAGIQTIDFISPQTGRNYDYAPGGGLRAGATLPGRMGRLGHGAASG